LVLDPLLICQICFSFVILYQNIICYNQKKSDKDKKVASLYIDMGGTWLRWEYKEKSGKTHSKSVGLVEFIEEFLQNHKDIKSVSVSFAGQVNKGEILSSPNISIKTKKIKEYFTKKYGIAFKIDNDLNCALLAYKSKLKSNFVALFFVGTGVGCSVLENSHTVRGKGNLACEIGHIPFKKAPFKCGCGKDNCLELFCGGEGLKRWCRYYGLKEMSLLELKNSKTKEAKKIYKNFQEAILFGVGTLVTLANPNILILGGGVLESNPYILDIIEKKICSYALKESCKDLKIVINKIKNPSLKGAKLL